jgi:hypothetical protein
VAPRGDWVLPCAKVWPVKRTIHRTPPEIAATPPQRIRFEVATTLPFMSLRRQRHYPLGDGMVHLRHGYSPEYVEGQFSELRLEGVLGSPHEAPMISNP